MLEGRLDEKIVNWLHYMASPGVIIPVLLLLMLVIYFLVSLERTEEKKKIFELAGGGNKRKPNEFGRAEKKKKVVTYLPIVEQKRREPWRAFNGALKHEILAPIGDLNLSPEKASLCLSMSLNIFFEDNGSTAFDSKPQSISKSISLAKSNTTDRVDDWFNEADEETKSDYSYNVQEDVVQLVTPEEIRYFSRLIRPLRGSSLMLSSSFPKDADAGSFTVLFPTVSGSRHSIQCNSPTSLYENPSDEYSIASGFNRKSLTLLPRDDTCASIRVHESVLNGNGSKIRPSAVCQPQPSTYPHLHQPSLDPIIAADREKEIEEECPVDEAPTNQNQQQETGRRAETTSISSTKKFDPKLMATEFVPWPSMDEIQEQRLLAFIF
ncbi:unnamed protein product [Anisakis simplex]|uniref:Uncharacterized protein n=1 Tax=Anisakis simplex TaxID=6269 RepID=A0A0M3K368_ANISI|nr:unnamed protein product [Anisakis simplex]